MEGYKPQMHIQAATLYENLTFTKRYRPRFATSLKQTLDLEATMNPLPSPRGMFRPGVPNRLVPA